LASLENQQSEKPLFEFCNLGIFFLLGWLKICDFFMNFVDVGFLILKKKFWIFYEYREDGDEDEE
jgi:hypothetical protein